MRRYATPRAAGWTPRRPLLALPGRPGGISLRFLVAILVLPLLVGVAGPPPARGDELADAVARQKSLAARMKQQREQVAKLRSLQSGLAQEISSTQTALAGINANLAETKKGITRLATQITEVRAVYGGLVTQVALLDRQVVAIEEERAEKAEELRQRKALLGARVREAYRTDRTPMVQTILSAGTFTDLLEDVGSYLDFGEQDRALAGRIEADARTLDALRALLVDTRSARQELRDETLAQKRQLDAGLAELKAAKARLAKLQAETARELAIQRAAFARMAKNKGALQTAIARNVAAQKKLASQIASLVARQRSLGNIPSEYNGTLSWPMSATITQEFGCTGFPWEPAIGGCAHFHQGIDLAAPMYTPIRAAGAGVVVFAGPNPYDPYPKAWIVIIAHSESLQTWYAHIDNGVKPPAVSAGDNVVEGQVIAYVGMTGRTTGPHLHWAVVFNESFANPRLFV
ncbi:MAG TPA: peptidoglycan DD-metalloendopeptidase family protein [Candidatus Nanopelagicales bacterium]|nr:peptidoglycan DD-metalloendopeptidase family protein [Candidatus Nanopelagicales bacterium]